MIQFNISPINENYRKALQAKVDDLTKPKGSLGLLEDIAIQIGMIQETLSPALRSPHHIVFAADHGITDERVSISPKEVTQQMVYNFLEGGAGVNFLARQHSIDLSVVDVGVDYDFEIEAPSLFKNKIRHSTRNFLHEAAMTADEACAAIQIGAEATQRCADKGCNIISFGEMGISNTSASSLWISLLMGLSLEECVGAGCDHSGGIVAHKYRVLNAALQNYKGDGSAFDTMCYFGGYEMVAAVGAMLKAAELKMVVMVDGFIMTACAMMAVRMNPNFAGYAIYGHQGDEAAHKKALAFLNAKPLLHLNLRLGEGTGALCAYPIVESGVRMINEMASFGSVDVNKYFE